MSDNDPQFDTQFFLEVLLKGTGFPGSANNVGEVSSPLPDKNHTGLDVGELRLQSDFAFAHDPSTACTWQSQINNQKAMMSRFQEAMKRLAIVGHNRASLIDCSEVLPHPAPPVTKPAT
jgi:cytochrome c peroxidase